jgi:predicted DCC family thiol-disulfide oxidoreductase YuxK
MFSNFSESMKNNKIILYDDACPLCSWYTGAFVKTGLLDKEGRKAFSTATPELLQCIDRHRGVNEIPLLDNDTKEVLYGIDALVAIIGQRCPFIRILGNKQPVYWILKKIYNFISYNRKVIVARKSVSGTVECNPDFDLFYRVLFMGIFLCFNTIMLFPLYEELISKTNLISISLDNFQLAHAVLVAINCALALMLTGEEAIEYLGQVNMLALVTILMLLPLILLNNWFPGLSSLNYIYFSLLTLFIIKEYFRRMEYAGVTKKHKNIVAINLVCLAGFVASLFVL